MIQVRRSKERGHANHGWLDSYHSFSFARYYDAAHMGYSVLRVINEDVIAPAQGFGMHPHRDMEIITYMLAGELRHEDSLSNGSVIRAGDVQRMTAGSGIVHSESNPSASEAAHLLQIWILPERNNLTPGYEEKHFSATDKQGAWRLIASHDGRDNSLHVHQDMALYAAIISPNNPLAYEAANGRSLYLQVARGSVRLDGQLLDAGDAAKIDALQHINLEALEEAEVLLFDLPPTSAMAETTH